MLVNILGILAVVALAVSGWLAWENKGAYETQIAARQNEEKLLKVAQDDNTTALNNIKIAEDDLATKQSTQEEVEGEVADQQEVLDDIEVEIEDQKLNIGEKKEELAELEIETRELGEADELIADVKRYQLQINELETELSTAQTSRSVLDNSSDKLKQEISVTKGKIELYNSSSSSPDLKTSVAQVFNGYGFVTLRGGDSAGIIKGSTLDVVRGGETVAKLLVTTVESGSAAADIIPESVLADTSVRAGDTVVSGTPIAKK